MKKNIASLGLLLATSCFLAGCGSATSASDSTSASASTSTSTSESASTSTSTSTSEVSSTSEESTSSSESVVSSESESFSESTSTETLSVPELGTFSILNGSSLAEGFTFDEATSTYTISTSGTYTLTGTLEGSIVCASTLSSKVTLLMSGACIYNATGPAISWLSESKNVTINTLVDTINYVYEGEHAITDEDLDSTMSAIYSENNVNFEGAGTLYVTSLTKHAVDCSDFEMKSTGTVNLKATSDGIHAKSAIITNGVFNIDECSDGIQADLNSSNAKGTVVINGGTTTISDSTSSAITVETSFTINDGNLILSGNEADIVYPDGGYISNGGTVTKL